MSSESGFTGLQRDFDLSSLNTLAVPSRSQFFCEVSSVETLQALLAWAKQNQVPVAIIGTGSNVLLPEYLAGLVIKLNICGKTVQSRQGKYIKVRVGAGENWHEFVLWSINNKAYGLENLALIPGSVGAAPIQNIGAYGVEVSAFISSVETIDINTGKEHIFTPDECAFRYRDSFFKSRMGCNFAITHVEFQLSILPQPVITYPALRDHFSALDMNPEYVTPEDVSRAVIQIRSEKLPDPHLLPNVGSFFKNPIIDISSCEKLREAYPGIVAFDYDVAPGMPMKKLAAAWLIEYAGWKNKPMYDVCVSARQALVVINPNRKPLSYVLKFASALQKSIADRFAVNLHVEPQVLETKVLK